ncbi:MAG: type II secretion system protein, partial [Bdellovibrio sp.]
MLYVLNDRRGFSLVEILVSLGLLGILITGGATVLVTGQKMAGAVQASTVVEQYQSRISAALKSNGALELMATANSWACLKTRNGSDCPSLAPNTEQPLTIVEGNGTVLAKADGSVGFTVGGVACSPFGGDSCPYRYQVFLTKICHSASCSSAQFLVRGLLTDFYGAAFSTSWAPDSGFRLILGPVVLTSESLCLAMNGIVDPVTGNCTLALGADCPDGQKIVGISASTNTIECSPLYEGGPYECLDDEKLSIDENGNVRCSPLNCSISYVPPCYIDPSMCATVNPICVNPPCGDT